MARIEEPDLIAQTVEEVAARMVTAARTAPKTRGKNDIRMMVVTGEDIEKLAVSMEEIGQSRKDAHFFLRDAGNIRKSSALVLLAAHISPARLPKCGMCGYTDCDEKDNHPDTPCVFNTIDLGIAIGSAVGVAANHHVDNRVMYTIGQAALDLGFFPESYRVVIGIPLSASTKNIFFDRR